MGERGSFWRTITFADLREALGHALRNMPSEADEREDYVGQTWRAYEAEVRHLPSLTNKKGDQEDEEPWYPF